MHPTNDLLINHSRRMSKNGTKARRVGHDMELDAEGFTLLHRAAELGKGDLVKQLIELNANLEAKDPVWENSPLFRAVLANKLDVAKILIDARADINTSNKDGVTVLYQSTAFGFIDMVKLLIQAGAKIDQSSNGGQTPLHAACLNRKVNIAEVLIESGANVESRTKSCVSPLYIATEQGSIELIALLVASKASPDAVGPEDVTPLMRAAYKDQPRVVQLLLELQASPHLAGNGRTALDWARHQGHTAVIEILTSKQPYSESINSSASKTQPQQARPQNSRPFELPSLPAFLGQELGEILPLLQREDIGMQLLWTLSPEDIDTLAGELSFKQGHRLKLKQKLKLLQHSAQQDPSESYTSSIQKSPRLWIVRIPLVIGTLSKLVTLAGDLAQKRPTSLDSMMTLSLMHKIDLLRGYNSQHRDILQNQNQQCEYVHTPGSPSPVFIINSLALGPSSQPVGAGNQAQVYITEWSGKQSGGKQKYVVKRPSSSTEARQSLKQEYNVWVTIPAHPNVAQLRAMVRGPNGDVEGLVSDYHPLGSLDRLKVFRLEEDDLLMGIRGIAKALVHLHSLDIVHRDISPRNILLATNKEFIVTDFGLSCFGEAAVINEKLPWRSLAPEILRARRLPLEQKRKEKTAFSWATDMWAFGVLVWELANAKEGYSEYSDIGKAQLGIEDGSISLDLTETALNYPRLASVLLGCLERDPAKRLNAREVLQLLGDS